MCQYTRDEIEADCRSPWSNAYIPESPGAPTPSSKLRQLEVSLNSAFVTYKEMYFEGGVSSVYLWDLEEQQGRELAFAGVVLLKKSKSLSHRISEHVERSMNLIIALPTDAEHTGSWDSLHVFECQERGRSAKYKLTSTVMLVLKSKTTPKSENESGKGSGDVALSGSMTRQVNLDHWVTRGC